MALPIVLSVSGYCFLLFQEEISVQTLIDACMVDDSKLYWCVSSPTMKDKPVSPQLWAACDGYFNTCQSHWLVQWVVSPDYVLWYHLYPFVCCRLWCCMLLWLHALYFMLDLVSNHLQILWATRGKYSTKHEGNTPKNEHFQTFGQSSGTVHLFCHCNISDGADYKHYYFLSNMASCAWVVKDTWRESTPSFIESISLHCCLCWMSVHLPFCAVH